MKRCLFVFTCLFLATGPALAEVFWTAPLSIKRLELFYDDYHAHSFLIVEPTSEILKEDGSEIPSGCQATDTKNTIGHWTQNWTQLPYTWYAALLHAYTNDTQVHINLNSGQCGGVTGMRVRGVKLIN